MLDWIAPVACAGCGQPHDRRLCPECLPPVVYRAPTPAEGVAGFLNRLMRWFR